MINIDTLTIEEFKQLPLVIEGESKEVRYAGNGHVVIRLKPTIYSYTHNRIGVIDGSDIARLRVIKVLVAALQKADIAHSYIAVNNQWILSHLVLQPRTRHTGELVFTPHDLTDEQLNNLPTANPIEVIVKRYHTGTPKHRYANFDIYPTIRGTYIGNESKYPNVIVRFDWRNPMIDAKGNRLADEVLPEDMAKWFIDTQIARHTVTKAFTALSRHLSVVGIELRDICFFVTTDGKMLFGEVSPDGMRVRDVSGALDKDVWRAGGSSVLVLDKWQQLADIVEQ
ncbi:hypothetical protein EOL96_01120 [Candidatus Saccharibacteria bacterium]|nr:hypothetical protein [Candidatus Saccharibacteria bacterium]